MGQVNRLRAHRDCHGARRRRGEELESGRSRDPATVTVAVVLPVADPLARGASPASCVRSWSGQWATRVLFKWHGGHQPETGPCQCQ
jgi:hypothetical protein